MNTVQLATLIELTNKRRDIITLLRIKKAFILDYSRYVRFYGRKEFTRLFTSLGEYSNKTLIAEKEQLDRKINQLVESIDLTNLFSIS